MLDRLFDKLFRLDERSVMHRYYSTRWAMVVGSLMIAAWLCYEFFANRTLRLDLVVISAAIALTKIVAMLYYRAAH